MTQWICANIFMIHARIAQAALARQEGTRQDFAVLPHEGSDREARIATISTSSGSGSAIRMRRECMLSVA